MDFEFKKVECNKHGGCYVCKDSLRYNKDTDTFVDKYETVNSFKLNNQIIRICDEHLNQLIKEGNEFLSR